MSLSQQVEQAITVLKNPEEQRRLRRALVAFLNEAERKPKDIVVLVGYAHTLNNSAAENPGVQMVQSRTDAMNLIKNGFYEGPVIVGEFRNDSTYRGAIMNLPAFEKLSSFYVSPMTETQLVFAARPTG
jgi:hypothetical protein